MYPKFFTCLKNGDFKKNFFQDLFAGIAIGIISLPMIMAFSMASGLPPERGLFTGIVAGFIISFLGGSRVQIGGPTGAFVIVIYSIVERHGYEGLVIATLLAGVMMIGMAFARAGSLLKYIPYPVVTGFTAGIAINLFTSQIKDFFGFSIHNMPADFLEKIPLYAEHFSNGAWNGWALAIGSLSLISLFGLRKKYPKIPGNILVVGIATVVVYFFNLPVETIESKFGGIPSMLPAAYFPKISLHQIQILLPDAIAIALLSSIESLLSAAVADKITGTRHRSSAELLATGVANILSPIFGGIPATGAIARTAANARMGANTPFAGMMHAVTLFILMVVFSSAAAKIPLVILAAILMFVAWNMSEKEHIAMICKGPKTDVLMLFVTMALTLLMDIIVAVEVGMILAAFFFMKKMAQNTHITSTESSHFPEGVTVYELNGPLFYGISEKLHQKFISTDPKPRAFVFRLNQAPIIDSTAVHTLQEIANHCSKSEISFFLSDVHENNKQLFKKMGLSEAYLCTNLDEALDRIEKQNAPLV